ncbi:MAG: glycerol-3-phosphate dehydrogenase, partial [Aestuariivirga sp.]
VWELTIVGEAGKEEKVRARALVNAAGPWVSQVLGEVVGRNAPDKIRLVRGSHIVVDKLYGHDRSYIFQNADGRICFAIPYEQNFTLIGTTDEDHEGDPGSPHISDAETGYLLASVAEYFRQPVTREQIRWTYSGIRPLYDDGASRAQEGTRDYVLKLDAAPGEAPLLSIFGGKITTFRKLAEAAMEQIRPFFPNAGKPWTAAASFPGGDFSYMEVEKLVTELQRKYSFMTPRNVRRIFHAYGTEAESIFDGARFAQDMGKSFGLLTEREIDHLTQKEWARTAEDILWRRSKLGLHLSKAEQEALGRHLTPEIKIKRRKRVKG